MALFIHTEKQKQSLMAVSLIIRYLNQYIYIKKTNIFIQANIKSILLAFVAIMQL